MTDDSRVRDDATVDASAFLDWLDEMAAAEGKSREDLIQTLVSSYWTLDEMFRLMEQADPDSELPVLGDPGEPGGAERERDRRRGRVHGELVEQVEDLADRVDSLETRLADERPPSPTGTDELDALAEELEAVEAALHAEHEALRERVDTEFGNLHAILEHLIGSADGLEGRTERLETRLEGDLRAILASRDRLTGLKRTAAQVGARTAKCGYCGTKIDVALLPTPECPRCDRRFRDVEPKRGWFGSTTLEVESESAVERSRPDRNTWREGGGASNAGRASRPDGETTDATEFDWIGEGE